MKTTFLYVAAFSLLGSVAMATPVDDLVKSLTDQGATNVEVSRGDKTTKVEGVVDGRKVEVTIDNETGNVVKQETDSVDGATGSTNDSANDNSNDSADSGDSGDSGDSDSSDGSGEGDGSGHDGSGHDGGDHEGSGHDGGGSGGDND